MNPFSHRPALRWIVPLGAAVLFGTAGVGLSTLNAAARSPLPSRTPAQLLVDVEHAHLTGLSGTVVETSNLGLPALPSVAGASSTDFTSLVAGSHTLRVWYAGPDRARLALLGDLGESDLVRNGSDLWLWSSSSNTAEHSTVPATSDQSEPQLPTEAMTPQQAADAALAAITPTTTVTTDRTAVVAGRSAYQLVLTPKDPATLVGSVRIAIDGTTHVPTRVQVFAKGSGTPGFEVGFTSFDPSTPSASVFSFDPPPGAKVTEGIGRSLLEGGPTPSDAPAGPKPTVVGKDWSSVVVGTLPGSTSTVSSDSGGVAAILKRLPTVSGSWGTGHLLRGSLFSVLLTDDGRVAAGAVAPEALEAALTR